METAIPIISIIIGLIGLVGGGEFLIRNSSKLAAVAGISPLVIGLTVVAFATSAPELTVVIQASFLGKADLAIGNAVGSNITNVLFVLGISALVAPLVVNARLVRLDIPVMIGTSFLLLLLSLDGSLDHRDGALMFVLLIVYIIWTIRESAKAEVPVKEQFAGEFGPSRCGPVWMLVVGFVTGVVLLLIGAHFTLDGCVSIAKLFGVSELIIGLTVVALGTSLPEVVTSVVASIHGERDIAVGNIIGSNMFNILGVLGIGGIVSPSGIDVTPVAIQFDMPVMIAAAIVCLPIFFVGNRIARWEGGVLVGYYFAYTSYLILEAVGQGMGRALEVVLVLFAIPLTTVTMLIGVYRYWRMLRLEAVGKE